MGRGKASSSCPVDFKAGVSAQAVAQCLMCFTAGVVRQYHVTFPKKSEKYDLGLISVYLKNCFFF